MPGGLRSQRAPQALLGASQGPFHSVRSTSFVLLQEGYKPCAEILVLPHVVGSVLKRELGFISYGEPALHLLHMLICSGKNHRKANHCPGKVFRQTSNVSPVSECGVSDIPPLCLWVIMATVVWGWLCLRTALGSTFS